MKIIVQDPEVKLPDLMDSKLEFLQCADAARVSRGIFEEYYIVKEAEKLIGKLLRKEPFPHESVLEHGNIKIDFIMSRIASHEVVRHRHASPTQESTRYVNLAKADEVVFIRPPDASKDDIGVYTDLDIPGMPVWAYFATNAFRSYNSMIKLEGWKRESARYLLPHCLATKITITANFREWRHIVRLRTHKTAAPEMRMIFGQVKEFLGQISPVLLEGI